MGGAPRSLPSRFRSRSPAPAHPLTRSRRFPISSVQAPVAPVTNAAEPSYDAPAATYAVVDIGGHQLIVEEGRWYTVNRLDVPDGSVIELGRVLALKHDGEFKVGQPYLDGVKVTAEILGEEKGDKVIVYKMKPKKHYRRTNGHRQPLTKFLVTKISS
jgi:large subunit ribosomal protein L21